jgi:hypothetical protein
MIVYSNNVEKYLSAFVKKKSASVEYLEVFVAKAELYFLRVMGGLRTGHDNIPASQDIIISRLKADILKLRSQLLEFLLEDVDHFSSNLPVFCHESNQCLSLRV